MSCQNCEVRKILQDSLEFERERNKELQAKLVAMASPMAYQFLHGPQGVVADNEYYGVGKDEFYAVDQWGEKVIQTRESKEDE